MPDTDLANDPLLTDLTAPQREAVAHNAGPLLVLAGAGSGKTRVITRRIAYLIHRHDVAPWQVLAITFTNKAAGEMRDRVAALVSPRQAAAASISTFHSFCARVLRQYSDRIGLPPGYTIYDTADQKRAIKQAVEAVDLNTSNFPPAKTLGAISQAKNDMLDADAYAKQAGDFFTRNIAKIYHAYTRILQRNKAVDFDDLLLKTVDLLRGEQDVLDQMRDRYRYILIDEYQDTNHVQFVLAHMLAGERRNLMATGDPDQSIYSWRGADIRNILDFEQQYPDCTIVRLEQNYRSTKSILAAADALIRNNEARRHKDLWTDNEAGDPVHVVTCYDQEHEAKWIAQTFEQWRDEMELSWSDFAIFYRVNALSRSLEDELRRSSIPYQVARGTSFYDRKEIKDMLAYLQVIANPADEVNLLRIINTPARGISDKTQKMLQAHAAKSNSTVHEMLYEAEHVPSLNTRAVNSVLKFAKLLRRWRWFADLEAKPSDGAEEDKPHTLRGLVENVLRESGLQDHYASEKSDPDDERLMNLGELVTAAQEFDATFEERLEPGQEATVAARLLAYLEQVSLVADIDSLEEGSGAVTLMTLHAAKGLEYPVVAIAGVEDGLLPHERSQSSETQMEEERRLCFVGITRAQRRLVLLRAKLRTVFGQKIPTMESRFLGELPAEQIEAIDASDDYLAGDDDLTDTSGPSGGMLDRAARRFPPGTLVQHDRFGLGRVEDVSAQGSHTKARIRFEQAGTKTLILQYAPLTVLG